MIVINRIRERRAAKSLSVMYTEDATCRQSIANSAIDNNRVYIDNSMTKQEQYAGLALSGLLAHCGLDSNPTAAVTAAHEYGHRMDSYS